MPRLHGVALETALPVPPGEPVSTCLLALDDTPFDASRFEREDVARPAAIDRSVPGRQAEFFFGRLAARIALARCGVAHAQVPVGASREPVWPAGIVGSLTHCRGYAAAAVAPGAGRRAIGIDLERVAGGEALAALRAVALVDEELVCLEQAGPAMADAHRITLAFSAKESFYKAVFPSVRRILDFDVVRLERLSLVDRRMTLRVVEDLASDLRPGRRVEVAFELVRADVVFTYVAW